MQDKATIRKAMRARRKALSPEARMQVSRSISAQIAADPSVAAALDGGALAVYLASSEEIDLTDLITWALGRGSTVVAPRWNGTTYDLAQVKSLEPEDLREGPMHILEPADERIVAPEDVAVWIVPGLAFTNSGKRLGYGGGWYDRLMVAADPSALKLGVAHAFQLVDDLPSEPHDIPLTSVIAAEA